MAPVTLRKLVKRYGALEVVHGIDLEVKDREFIALVGPSGCGKSTTLRMIAGLEDVSDGAIEIGGKKVNDLPPRARNISMVFQSYALYPHMTVAENMGFAEDCRALGRRNQDAGRRGRRHPRSRPSPGAPPVAAFRRPAPACCHGTGDRASA